MNKTLAVPATFALIAFLAASLPALADAGGIYGAGGTVSALSSGKSVRMVAETVICHAPEGSVDATFVFHNDGAPINVRMGFPESNRGTGIHDTYTAFKHFVFLLDGQQIETTRYPLIVGEQGGERFDHWWIKTVHFNRDQTRIIVDRYSGGVGVMAGGEYWLPYTLRTGASWKGPIGDVTVTYVLGDRVPEYFRSAEPKGYVRHSNTLVWHWHNLTPTDNDDLSVLWTGAPYVTRGEFMWPVGSPWNRSEWGSTKPSLRNGYKCASTKTLAAWLGADRSKEGTDVFVLRRTSASSVSSKMDYWVRIRAGSNILDTNSGKITMRVPAIVAGNDVIVPMALVGQALGYNLTYDPDHHSIYFH